MTYLAYAMRALMAEDRDAAARRLQRKRRLRQEREQAVLLALADALPKDLDRQLAPRPASATSPKADLSSARPAQHGA